MKRLRRVIQKLQLFDRLLDDARYFARRNHALSDHDGSFLDCEDSICADEVALFRSIEAKR
ncbi:MAG: hypothetical protein QOJ81_1326 [Chloroflexota bacterium]|jgi:hypothetical protein|nr:hypothetical protein [Chloroflexota bacterium]